MPSLMDSFNDMTKDQISSMMKGVIGFSPRIISHDRNKEETLQNDGENNDILDRQLYPINPHAVTCKLSIAMASVLCLSLLS